MIPNHFVGKESKRVAKYAFRVAENTFLPLFVAMDVVQIDASITKRGDDGDAGLVVLRRRFGGSVV